MATGQKVLELDKNETLHIIRLIRARQDDCRRVTPEFDGYETLHQLDEELEVFKMKLINRIPEGVSLID